MYFLLMYKWQRSIVLFSLVNCFGTSFVRVGTLRRIYNEAQRNVNTAHSPRSVCCVLSGSLSCEYLTKMPVLMADSATTQSRPAGEDVDKLVEEVRERLCLKSREKLHAVRRVMPYGRKVGSNHYDRFQHLTHRSRAAPSKHLCSHSVAKTAMCKCSDSTDLKKTPDLLKQLLSEHRLIQEAVRRIRLLQHQYGDSSSPSLESPSPCSVGMRSSSSDSMDSTTFCGSTDL